MHSFGYKSYYNVNYFTIQNCKIKVSNTLDSKFKILCYHIATKEIYMSICIIDTYDIFVGQREDVIKMEIDTLKRRIRYLKRKTKREIESGEMVWPSTWVKLSYAKDELREAKRAYLDSGYTYEMTRGEMKKERFLEGIENLKGFSLRVTAVLYDTPSWFVDVDGETARGSCVYIGATEEGVRAEREKFDFKRSELLELLKELDIDEWRKNYVDPLVLDGEYWEIKLTYQDGKERTYSGENAYPFSYHHLLEGLERFRKEFGRGVQSREGKRK